MLAMLTFLAAGATAPCSALPGVAEILVDPHLQWLILGEQHGTVEAPQAFADVVCHASRSGRRVTVGLEIFDSEQPLIDAFMASDGGPAARAALLTSQAFAAKIQDGRGSRAMHGLLERLRVMAKSGQIRRVVACRPVAARNAEEIEAGMARMLGDAAAGGDMIVAMAGNVHAGLQRVTFGAQSYVPAAARLPRAATLTLNVQGNGGAQWSCFAGPGAPSPAGAVICGPRDLGLPPKAPTRGIVLDPSPDARWSGRLNLGVPTTAAPPAKGG